MNFALTDPETTLLERGDELAGIAAALAAAPAGDGSLIVLEGPAGIGKTRLADAAREQARAVGMTVLSARGSELERGFGFGIARRLFEPVLAGADADLHAALLDGPARLAAPALGLAGAAPAGPLAPADQETQQAVVHGLYWLAANLGAQGPALLAIDDLQWADEPSQRYLAYLARRLEGAGIALLVALRPAAPGEDRSLVDALVEEERATVLRPAPLSPAAVGAVAAARLGAPADPAFATACHHATGGNALLVSELLRALREQGTAPDAAGASAVAGMGPERVARAVRRRIDALPAGAAELTRAVAVLGEPAPLDLAAQLAGIGDVTAVDAVSGLAAADVLEDGLPLRFRHPVVREAVAGGMPAVEWAAAHGAAARLVAARHAPPAEVAAHLLAAAPAADPWVVERLREAGREARAQGAPEQAAAYLTRALAEPPPADARLAVSHELGAAQLAAGRDEGVGNMQGAIALAEDPRDRARLALELGDWLFRTLRGAEAATIVRRALADLGDADRELGLLLEGLLAEGVRMDLGVGGDEVETLRRRAAGLAGETPAERYVLALVANVASNDTAADHARVTELTMASAADVGRLLGSPDTGIASNLIRAGRFEQAEAFIAGRVELNRREGRVASYALMLNLRGWLKLERGDLAAAEADLRSALELTEELGGPAGFLGAMLALVLAEQGRLEEAERMLVDHGMDGPVPEHQVFNLVLYGRARVRAAQGRRREALADALEVGRRYERLGIRRAVPAWRSLAALQLHAEGDAERARSLVEEELVLAERWGTPMAIGIALRGAGLLDGDAGRLAEAVEVLEASPGKLELARSRVELGAAMRRGGRRADARGPLRAGMDLADACGAAGLAERAREELRATGARPRRLALSGAQALTAGERRVAELAAGGLTNRRIAQELFVTTATVETHLRHVFQKLDIGSRGQLAAALTAPRAPST